VKAYKPKYIVQDLKTRKFVGETDYLISDGYYALRFHSKELAYIHCRERFHAMLKDLTVLEVFE